MINIYLDIETIPSQSQSYRDEVLKDIKPPAQYKKPESINQWILENGPEAANNIIAKTSFDPAYGHICCLAYAIGDGEVQHFEARSVDDEAAILESFFDVLPKVGLLRFIGHYVAQFDLRFILCRAIVLGVKLSPAIPRDAKPWDEVVFDTMTAWAGSKGSISQNNLAKALGLKGKGDFNGTMVADAWAKGEFDKIADYCKDDVETVRAIHRKFEAVNF